MAITVNHSTLADASFSATGAAAWDANHTLSGLGTMAEQNANNVAITGGTITGVTGVGDVVGPASATDNAIARFDTTTGKLIQNSVVTIGDTGAATGITTLAASTSVTTPIVQATNSAGLALKNASGTTQMSMGAGGGDNMAINVSTNLNGTNAQIDISPTGTGHVHMKPSGTGSIEIAPTNVGTMDNMTIGATTPKAITGTTITATTFSGSGASLTGVVTSVTGTSPVVSSGGATPAISIAAATTSVNGYLTSTDWTTFNGKQALLVSGTNIKTINGNTLLGSGDLTVSASAGGSNTQIQYNNTGALAGSANFTWDGTTVKATNVETTGGILADGNFSGTYVDGIVVDYDSGSSLGRISVGGSDGLAFYNGGVAGSTLGSINNNGDWSIARFLDVGNGTLIGGATNPIIAAAGSAAGYVQIYIHNDNSGSSSSSDIAAYPDNGTDASGYIDMGITSSTYSDATYPIYGANEGYLIMSAPSGTSTTGNLVYATDSTGTQNYHQWYVGNFGAAKSAWKMQLKSTALDLSIPLNSTVATGTAPFTVASTTQVANLNAATAGTAGNVTGTVLIGNGGTGQTTQTAAFDALSPTTTKGDLIVYDGTDNVRLATGTNTFVLSADSTTATGLKWVAASGFTGGTLTSNLTLATGTTSVIPLTLVSGTLNTTASAGAIEYLGNTPYFSVAASTRGVLRTEQWVVLTSANNLTSQVGVQPIFDGGGGPTNGSVTLPIGTYQFECVYALTAMSATSGSFGFALGGAATFTYSYDATASKAGTAAATSQAGFKLFSSAAATALVTNSTGTVGSALIKGIIRVTAAGTIIPQVSLTVAAAAIVSANSYFKVSPLGNVSTVATVGNWA